MTPAECNYDIHHKELLAIVKELKEWCHLLEGTALPVQIITDHKNLEPFKVSKDLRGCLARWAGFLSKFNFQLKYCPGKTNGKADILSRKDEHQPLGGVRAELYSTLPFILLLLSQTKSWMTEFKTHVYRTTV
ncbi:Transposon Tf2-1 polyprotein [Ceratobasidium sp. AG-Ba]|nr:Transposon Tf2-1 polyprotein [Ceratobasidium sp. AG-Ba]